MVGPTFYGESSNRSVNSITESTTIYTPITTAVNEAEIDALNISIFPNPTSELIAIQLGGLVNDELKVELMDLNGRIINSTQINKGSTIAHFDLRSIYAGTYLIKLSNSTYEITRKIIITK